MLVIGAILTQLYRTQITIARRTATYFGIEEGSEKHKKISRNDKKNSVLLQKINDNVKNVIEQAYPKHIIVIGKGVERALRWRLGLLRSAKGISYTALPQPQGNRGTREEQLETYKQYQRICSKC